MRAGDRRRVLGGQCETPKSPPGDYNQELDAEFLDDGGAVFRVKHLNPRQGITTERSGAPSRRTTEACETPKSPPGDYNDGLRPVPVPDRPRPRCETPKSPPGDYNETRDPQASDSRTPCSVKHLNPRQGITTHHPPVAVPANGQARVKHLNPRQGITTDCFNDPPLSLIAVACETPKSPPGDYNFS